MGCPGHRHSNLTTGYNIGFPQPSRHGNVGRQRTMESRIWLPSRCCRRWTYTLNSIFRLPSLSFPNSWRTTIMELKTMTDHGQIGSSFPITAVRRPCWTDGFSPIAQTIQPSGAYQRSVSLRKAIFCSWHRGRIEPTPLLRSTCLKSRTRSLRAP
jgi:hypothetical protein